jgi:uncharacterized membrane protein
MSLEPLNSASSVIQIHAWTAIAGVLLGAVVLWRRKGTSSHRYLGRVWFIVMLVSVGTSFFIHMLRTWGPWSPIHILSVLTLVLMVRAYIAIRKRRVPLHNELMKACYYNALLLAAFFTFMPGRIMYEVVFGVPKAQANYTVPLWVWIVLGVLLIMGSRKLIERRLAQRKRSA